MAKDSQKPAAAQNTEGTSASSPDAPKDFFLKKICPWDLGGVEGEIHFIFGNGSKLVLVLAKVAEAMLARLTAHGGSQKVGDAAAGFSKSRDFASAYDACSSVIEALYSGAWSIKGDGASVADLAKAISILKKCSVEAAEAAIAKMDEEAISKIKAHPEVKVRLAEIRAERAKQAAKAAKSGELVIPGL